MTKFAALEDLVHGRRLVDAAGDRLEVAHVEDVRVEAAVPADDVERVERQRVDRADDATRAVATVLDVDLGLLVGARADVLGEERTVRLAQVALAVGGVLEELAVLAEIALGRRDVAVRLDAVRPQRLVAGDLGEPPVRRRPRDDDVVALADVEGAEDRLDAGSAALDVDALVADPVAVPGARRARDGIRDAHVTVAEDESATGDDVGALDRGGVEEVMELEVPGRQRMVRRRRLVRDPPHGGADRRRRDVAVVEQGAVGAEALLAHQLLVVELARGAPGAGSAVLGVPLGRDAADRLVVRHGRGPLRRARPMSGR